MYQHFAFVYDDLMKDAPYDSWVRFLKKKIKEYNIRANRIVDVGCGTGELSIRLAEEGYAVTGVDLSSDMLTVAQSKSQLAGVQIPFVCQDMQELEGFEEADVIVVFCDSLNYILDEKGVQKTFQRIYDQLRPGGIICFDVHSLYKVDHIFMDHTFAVNDLDVSYIWNCFPSEWKHSVEHDLTFFIKNEMETYKRFDEFHVQRTYSASVYQAWLEEVGFKNISIDADFSEPASKEKAERLFFTAQK